MTNPHASALGKLAAGKPKNFSQEERERRRKLMEQLNALRERRKKIEKETKPIAKRWSTSRAKRKGEK